MGNFCFSINNQKDSPATQTNWLYLCNRYNPGDITLPCLKPRLLLSKGSAGGRSDKKSRSAAAGGASHESSPRNFDDMFLGPPQMCTLRYTTSRESFCDVSHMILICLCFILLTYLDAMHWIWIPSRGCQNTSVTVPMPVSWPWTPYPKGSSSVASVHSSFCWNMHYDNELKHDKLYKCCSLW